MSNVVSTLSGQASEISLYSKAAVVIILLIDTGTGIPHFTAIVIMKCITGLRKSGSLITSKHFAVIMVGLCE